jgi:hypothetical protein
MQSAAPVQNSPARAGPDVHRRHRTHRNQPHPLYRRHDLRQLIEQHRETNQDDLTSAQLAASIDRLWQAL